jgi:hypothetical protein
MKMGFLYNYTYCNYTFSDINASGTFILRCQHLQFLRKPKVNLLCLESTKVHRVLHLLSFFLNFKMTWRKSLFETRAFAVFKLAFLSFASSAAPRGEKRRLVRKTRDFALVAKITILLAVSFVEVIPFLY